MIEIKREGTKVILDFDTSISIEKDTIQTFNFSWESDSETYAELLVEKMRLDIKKNDDKFRKRFYEQGYRDGKNHKRKQV